MGFQQEIIQSFLSRCLLGKHKRFCVYILSINILLVMLIEGSNYKTRWGMYIPSLTSSPHTAGWHIFLMRGQLPAGRSAKQLKTECLNLPLGLLQVKTKCFWLKHLAKISGVYGSHSKLKLRSPCYNMTAIIQ